MPKLTKLSIKEFRQFRDVEIIIGSMLTVIAGQNGTGKSNILGLIGNCVEFNRKNMRRGNFVNQKLFRTEFEKLFKGTKEHDPTNPNRMTLEFDDKDYRHCRTTWQKYNDIPASRFRIIPFRYHGSTMESKEGRKDSKKAIPAIYLGLSRLYPFGEAENCDCINLGGINAEASKWIWEKGNYILSTNYDFASGSVDIVKISESTRKTGVGFNTNTYSSLANSSGQDNIGQILSAIWNIKLLKKELNEQFPGAILLIDEIDATLHPSSQVKLINTIIKEAKETNFQAIFTTHSLSLIKYIIPKTTGNENTVVVNYLTNANGPLECRMNPSFQLIENDLMQTTSQFPIRIKVYAEDDEARWFIDGLLKHLNLNNFVQLIDGVNLGCQELIQLNKGDRPYFKNVIIIFDGDVDESEINKYKNLIKIPGGARPESVLMDFLCNEESDDFYMQDGLMDQGVSRRNMIESKNKILERSTQCKVRVLYKNWLNEHLFSLNQFNVVSYWVKAHEEEVRSFEKSFKDAYYNITGRNPT